MLVFAARKRCGDTSICVYVTLAVTSMQEYSRETGIGNILVSLKTFKSRGWINNDSDKLMTIYRMFVFKAVTEELFGDG